MVFFSSRISPLTSTVILRDRSPRATAVVTSAMFRTCVVRLAASRLTLSVRSFQVPADAGHLRLTAELAFGADLARHARDLAGERVQLIDHRVDGSLSWRISPLTSTVIFFDRSPLAMAVATSAMLRTCAVRLLAIELTRVGEVLPRAGDAGHLGLSAQPAFGADFARDARHFAGERVQLVDHRVDGFLEQQDFAADVDRDLLREVAAGDGGRHFGDVAHLRR